MHTSRTPLFSPSAVSTSIPCSISLSADELNQTLHLENENEHWRTEKYDLTNARTHARMSFDLNSISIAIATSDR